ncbi:N4-gp56 family major capsid protein [Rheinheimera sp. MMS21-TC3]|uniref:N4-gp56 family major capsid protein n=1 Tax=Rheinheimera sp. MMS21-TC3 TaxID=3072790 RepID=UPI0028C48519|nr:N4-gp56 family major capsid protein [Rheinheimera sp. MMS21-TC3]WNO60441.1 N4-gp56 family major capsid protein [Rheinheimera sp. MMS21-TC3]
MANKYGDIPVAAGVKAEIEALKHAAPILVLNKIGKAKGLGRNESDTLKFRRIIPLALATTPLTEGVTPTGTDFRYENVNAVLKQYGDYMPTTDKVLDLHDNPVGKDMLIAASEQAAQTIEQVTYGVVIAGTNVAFANGAARNAVNTFLTKSLQQRVTRTLYRNKGKKMRSILSGSTNIGTQPIEAAYIALAHTDCAPSIRAMEGFVPVAKYGTRQALCDEELGSVDDVRYILTPWAAPFADAGGAKGTAGAVDEAMSTTGTNADVYPVLFFAEEAFGVVALKGTPAYGGAIKPTVVHPKPTSSDPLGQRGSVGWKTYYDALILNDLWMVRAEVAAPQNP